MQTSLAWREAGQGQPILLVHCFPTDGRLFHRQLAAAAAGRLTARVIAVDLPGFGRSPLPDPAPDRYTTAELGTAVSDLVVGLDLDEMIIGGVAIGGSVAVDAATRVSDRIAGLILIANKPGTDPVERAESREAAARRAVQVGSQAIASQLATAALSPRASPAVRRRVAGMIADAHPRAIAALVRAIAGRPDLMPMLSQIQVPALVVAGLDDPFSPPARVRELRSALPDAVLLEVPGAGHMVPIERPAAVIDGLAALLATTGATARRPTARGRP